MQNTNSLNLIAIGGSNASLGRTNFGIRAINAAMEGQIDMSPFANP